MADNKIQITPEIKARVEEIARQVQTGTMESRLRSIFADAERLVDIHLNKHSKLPTDNTEKNDFVQFVLQDKEAQPENQKNPQVTK